MSDDELRHLSPEQVIALVRQLESRLAAAEARQERVGTSQVVDLPPVQPVVLEAWRYAALCAHCGTTTTAPYPAGFEPTRVFGPHLEALWTYLHEQHHLSYARLARLARDLWQLGISQGALANALRRGAHRL